MAAKSLTFYDDNKRTVKQEFSDVVAANLVTIDLAARTGYYWAITHLDATSDLVAATVVFESPAATVVQTVTMDAAQKHYAEDTPLDSYNMSNGVKGDVSQVLRIKLAVNVAGMLNIRATSLPDRQYNTQ